MLEPLDATCARDLVQFSLPADAGVSPGQRAFLVRAVASAEATFADKQAPVRPLSHVSLVRLFLALVVARQASKSDGEAAFADLARVFKKEPAKVHVDLKRKVDGISLKGLSMGCFGYAGACTLFVRSCPTYFPSVRGL